MEFVDISPEQVDALVRWAVARCNEDEYDFDRAPADYSGDKAQCWVRGYSYLIGGIRDILGREVLW